MLGHGFLGLVVGLIALAPRLFPSLNAIVPTLAAAAVTILATWFVADAANIGVVRVIAPALVAVLPGLALTVAAMELADGQIIAGSSRLIYALVQLMLMIFGVALGVAVAGRVPPQPPDPPFGPWAFYAAILVVGVGLYIYLSAPRGSLVWLTLAVAVALLGQKFGELFVSSAHAGALGAALVLPFALVRCPPQVGTAGDGDVGRRILGAGARRPELRIAVSGRRGWPGRLHGAAQRRWCGDLDRAGHAGELERAQRDRLPAHSPLSNTAAVASVKSGHAGRFRRRGAATTAATSGGVNRSPYLAASSLARATKASLPVPRAPW